MANTIRSKKRKAEEESSEDFSDDSSDDDGYSSEGKKTPAGRKKKQKTAYEKNPPTITNRSVARKQAANRIELQKFEALKKKASQALEFRDREPKRKDDKWRREAKMHDKILQKAECIPCLHYKRSGICKLANCPFVHEKTRDTRATLSSWFPAIDGKNAFGFAKLKDDGEVLYVPGYALLDACGTKSVQVGMQLDILQIDEAPTTGKRREASRIRLQVGSTRRGVRK